MACSAYISYQLDSPTEKSAVSVTTTTIRIPNLPQPGTDGKGSNEGTPPASTQTQSTAFVLVDPSAPKSSGNTHSDIARKNIRKHASKACAARRLATIAAKKKSRNVLTKRERQKQVAAERLEAALQQHAQKVASSGDLIDLSQIAETKPPSGELRLDVRSSKTLAAHKLPTPDSDDSAENVATQGDVALSPDLDRKDRNIVQTSEPRRTSTTSSDDALRENEQPTSSALVAVQSRRLDPFSTFPVDIQDDGSLRHLFALLDKSIFHMMDLRLPMKFDKAMGTRYSHSRDLPHFVLSSEPLFWTMALCAATIFALQNRCRPGAEPLTMGYRYLAIRSVNQRLNSLGEDSVYDVGLIYAIASLGVWEREKGSKEVWHSHCQGIQMLSQRLRRASQHHLLSYIVGACHTAGSIPIGYEIGEGFRRMGDDSTLDPNLIAGIYECGQLDAIATEPTRTAILQSASSKLLGFRPSDVVPKTLCGSKGRSLDGDRRSIQMHVLLQGAGASLIKRLARQKDAVQDLDVIDFEAMCVEAVGLAEDISTDVAYDELLLWTVFTIFALNAYTEMQALGLVDKLTRRLRMSEWERVEMSLRLFVLLDSQLDVYKDFWNMVQRRKDSPARRVA